MARVGRMLIIFATATHGQKPDDLCSLNGGDFCTQKDKRSRSLLQTDRSKISPVLKTTTQHAFPKAENFANLESLSDSPYDVTYDDLGEYIKKKLLPAAEETRSEMQSELNRAVNMVTACNSQAWGVKAAMAHRQKILDSDEGAMYAAVAEEHRLHLEMNHSCGLVTDWMNGVQPPGRVDELEPKTAGGMLTLLHENLDWFTKETPVFTQRATKCDADIRAVAKLHGEVELDKGVADKYHCKMKAARDAACGNYDVCYKEKLHVYQQKKITVADLHKKNVEHFKKLSCAQYVDDYGVIQNKECNADAVVANHLDVSYPSDPMPIECPPLVKTRMDYSDVVCGPDGSVITVTTAAPEPVDEFTSTATAKPPPTTKATADDVSVAIVTTKVEGVNYTKLDENQRKTLREDLASEFAVANGLDASRVEIVLTAGSVEVQATIKSTSADSFKVKAPKASSVVASVKKLPNVENAMEAGREIKATAPQATVFAAQSTTGTATECESVDVPVPPPTPSPTAPPTSSPTAAEANVSNSTADSTGDPDDLTMVTGDPDDSTGDPDDLTTVAGDPDDFTTAIVAGSANATTNATASGGAGSENAPTTPDTAAPATESGSNASNASSTASTESGSTSTNNATASSSGNDTSTGEASSGAATGDDDTTASSSDETATNTTASSSNETATDTTASSSDATASDATASDATASDATASDASASDASASDPAANGTSSG